MLKANRIGGTFFSMVLAAGALLSVFSPTRASAQAEVTASRDVSVDVFGGVTTLSPHYGPDRDFGYMFGGDIQKHFHYLDAALDLRYTSANGTYADESSFLGGVRVGHSYRRFHPYIDFMIGHGTIRFDHPELISVDPNYTHDDSTVYDGGIGVDYSLTPRFAVKVDAQVQRWRTGQETQVFNPNNVTVGLVYHIPYRYLRPRGY